MSVELPLMFMRGKGRG